GRRWKEAIEVARRRGGRRSARARLVGRRRVADRAALAPRDGGGGPGRRGRHAARRATCVRRRADAPRAIHLDPLNHMHTRHLGPLTVSALGLGCMGMSEFYGPADEAEGIATTHRALDLGVTLLDAADVYGPHANEILVGKAIKGRREGVVVATKFGIVRDPNDPSRRGISGKPEYVRACCEASLKRLGIETIDLYYQHRIDRSTPIEETVGELSRLVEQGKVRYLGLSEASPAT